MEQQLIAGIQGQTEAFKNNLMKGFAAESGNIIIAEENPDCNAKAYQKMVAGRIGESIEKGISLAHVAPEGLTMDKVSTIAEVAALAATGDFEIYSQKDVNKFYVDIKKSLEDEVIERADWETGLKEVRSLNKAVIQSLTGEPVVFHWRHKERKTTVEIIKALPASEVLQKGEITDKLAYGYGGGNNETSFKFQKSGAELKVLLPKTIAKLEVERQRLTTLMIGYIAAAGGQPTELYFTPAGTNISINRYPWETTRTEYNELTKEQIADTAEKIAMRSYNDLCWNLRSVLEDITTCKIILNHVDEKKKYSMTVSQLVALATGDTDLEKAVNQAKEEAKPAEETK